MSVHYRKQFYGVVAGVVLRERVEGNDGECGRREEIVLMYFRDFLVWAWLL